MKKTIVALIILAAILTTTATIYTQNLKSAKITNNLAIAPTPLTTSSASSAAPSNTNSTNVTNTSVKQITAKSQTAKSINTEKSISTSTNNKINNHTNKVVISNSETSTSTNVNANLNANSNITNNNATNKNSDKTKSSNNIQNQQTSNTTKTYINKDKTNNSTTSTASTSNSSSNASTNLQESDATFNNSNNNSNSAIFSELQSQNKKYAPANTAIVTNLNDYKIIDGKKYYNIYEYKIGDSASDWVFDGNHSNFLGAKYMDVNGDVLDNQYIQDFSSLTTNEKATQIQNVANQFVSYFNYNGSVNVHMDKQINFDGYTCYLVTFGNKSFYMNPAGFIYISKSQSFY